MKLTVYYKKNRYIGVSHNDLLRKILKDFGNDDKNIIDKHIFEASHNLEEPKIQQNSINVKTLKKNRIDFKDGVSGANALLNVVAGNTVSQEEINRRAIICYNCKRKNEPTKSGLLESSNCRACGFSKRLNNYITKLKSAFGAGFDIPNNLSDKHCYVCECALSVMLPSKLNAFKHDKDKQHLRPDNCWLKKGSPNYEDK